ncbi:hypothetical protein EDF24_2621 [Curtobacterium sp. PhB130]|nr:hypothetical protein EDF24_2621 [Curtobacterium sp. PhB130]TCK63802.1 hypothetical protein EDF27_2349 [Curtobacterium sp. PhB136]
MHAQTRSDTDTDARIDTRIDTDTEFHRAAGAVVGRGSGEPANADGSLAYTGSDSAAMMSLLLLPSVLLGGGSLLRPNDVSDGFARFGRCRKRSHRRELATSHDREEATR